MESDRKLWKKQPSNSKRRNEFLHMTCDPPVFNLALFHAGPSLPLTEFECKILNLLWSNHCYFVDKTYTYCQPLIEWAIKASNSTLNRERIKVEHPLHLY